MAITGSPLNPPLPPADVRAEQAVLGALLANSRAYKRVSEFLAPEHFADPINGRIYQAIVRRIQAGELADAVTLEAEFERSGVLEELGGIAYLSELRRAGVRRDAGEDGHAIYDAWFHRGLMDEYAAIVTGAESDAAGLRWVVDGGQFAIERTTDPTDQSAAADPLRQQLQDAIATPPRHLDGNAGRRAPGNLDLAGRRYCRRAAIAPVAGTAVNGGKEAAYAASRFQKQRPIPSDVF